MERNTVQRRAIHRVFEEAGRPLGPPEVCEAARAHAPGLGIATVYRAIKTLLDEGWLAPVHVPGDAPRYEVAGKGHHHHFQCNRCRRVYDVEHCPDGLRNVPANGFRIESHELFLFGFCHECDGS